ncbi:MAG: signal recognition particle-docking protein FtsY, partial [Spirochaetales bacterium]
VIPISRQLGIPAVFLGTGEGYHDLRPFNRAEYLKELLDIQ